MTPRFLLASLVLAAVPCGFSQAAPPPPPAAKSPAPITHAHARADAGNPDDRDKRMMRGGEMHGPGNRLLPPGTWWRDAGVASRIGLMPDQQKRIDEIFLQSRVRLIHMHASLEEQELLLEPVLNANPVDQSKALEHIGTIADTRADLEKANAKMLLGIRAVLNADQWTKLQAERHGQRGRVEMRGDRGPEGRGLGERGGPDGQRGPMSRGSQQLPPAPPQ